MVIDSYDTTCYKNLFFSSVFNKLNDILFKKLVATLQAVCGGRSQDLAGPHVN